VCLLIVLHRIHADGPLIVAANRDEQISRPALSMTVLQEEAPRILGGRDLQAGGTWLATNEYGVVAGLTNLPISQAPRDPAKRSRGQLPLALAQHRSAEQAVEAFKQQYRPSDFNRAWILVGDRDSLFYVDMTGERVEARMLDVGRYVLENRPLGAESTKVRQVLTALEGIDNRHGDELISALHDVLRSHAAADGDQAGGTRDAPCVHAGAYGTRSAAIVVVPAGVGCRPLMRYTDGPPCASALIGADQLWQREAL